MMYDVMVIMMMNVVVIHVTHVTHVTPVVRNAVVRRDRRRWRGRHRIGLLGRHRRSRGRYNWSRRRWRRRIRTGAEKRQNAGNGD